MPSLDRTERFAFCEATKTLRNHYLRFDASFFARIIKAHAESQRLMGVDQATVGYIYKQDLFFQGQKHPIGAIRGAETAFLDPSLEAMHLQWYTLHEEELQQWQVHRQLMAKILSRGQTLGDLLQMFPREFYAGCPDLQHYTQLTRSGPSLYAGPPPAEGAGEAALESHQEARQEAVSRWGELLVSLYERVAPTVDFYRGYALL